MSLVNLVLTTSAERVFASCCSFDMWLLLGYG